PSKAKGSSLAHAFMIMSCDSLYLSRVIARICPQQKLVSIDVPTGNPATNRLPEMTSSIANSSATRMGGLYPAIELPITHSAAFDVRRLRVAAMRLGEGMRPYPF